MMKGGANVPWKIICIQWLSMCGPRQEYLNRCGGFPSYLSPHPQTAHSLAIYSLIDNIDLLRLSPAIWLTLIETLQYPGPFSRDQIECRIHCEYCHFPLERVTPGNPAQFLLVALEPCMNFEKKCGAKLRCTNARPCAFVGN